MLLYNYVDDVATRPLPVVTTEGFPFAWLDGVGYIDNALGTKLAGLVSSGNKVTLDLPWKPHDDVRVPRLMKNDISGVRDGVRKTRDKAYANRIFIVRDSCPTIAHGVPHMKPRLALRFLLLVLTS
jgi:hypothetical protein